MSDKNPQNVIESYQRKRQQGPRMFVLSAIALVLVFAGVIILWQWYTNPDSPMFAFLATETPTPTVTITPTPVTPTATPIPPTETATVTETPTITPTPTIEGPFFYTVQEGDTLFSIAQKFGVDVLRLMEVNNLSYDSVIAPLQTLLVPDPNEPTPTPTQIPANLPRGTKIEYRVRPNDTLTSIALLFNSTEEAILAANESITNANEIFVGQMIIVPVNLVTPAPTATGGVAPGATPGAIITLTPRPSPTP